MIRRLSQSLNSG
ncbi:hypothetical protein LINPERHAP1_LOCUS3379 [Linum perenne]